MREGLDNKGFTLLEMLVVIVIIGILMLPMLNMFQANERIIGQSTKKIEAKSIALLINKQIKNEIRFANNVVIDGEPVQDKNYIRVESGKVIRYDKEKKNEIIILSEGLIKPFTLNLQFKKSNQNVVIVSTTILDREKVIYKLDSAVQILNIAEGEIENHGDQGKQNVISYTIP